MNQEEREKALRFIFNHCSYTEEAQEEIRRLDDEALEDLKMEIAEGLDAQEAQEQLEELERYGCLHEEYEARMEEDRKKYKFYTERLPEIAYGAIAYLEEKLTTEELEEALNISHEEYIYIMLGDFSL